MQIVPCLALIGVLFQPAQNPKNEIKPSETKIFKKTPQGELKLHFFFPEGHQSSDKTPAIIFFFGGGWVGGSPSQFYPQSQHLAKRGMVAVCAEYRVSKQHKTTPRECVQDGKSAMRWVRSHAGELGIDPDRIAAGGGSAGGHVAAATATVKGFDEPGEDTGVSAVPAALVLFNPVYDNGPDGYGHDRVKDYWREFSPLHNIDQTTPPAIVFLGTEDKLIPVATGKAFQKKMKDLGLRSELILYEGQPHGFFNKSKYTETLESADEFLTSLGYLSKRK